MLAFLVLVLAALSRFLPHLLHHDGINLTAVGAGLLFFGSRQPRWQAAAAMAVMAAADVCLTLWVYRYPFHPQSYLVTWAWYAAVALIGSGLLRRVSVLRVAAAVVCSAVGFYVLSDFPVWLSGGLYPHTLAGLEACYIAALPFLRNDLISTAECSAIFFGLPAAISLMQGAERSTRNAHAAA